MNDRQNETHQDFLFCSSSGIFYQDQGERDGRLLADFDMDPIIPFYDEENFDAQDLALHHLIEWDSWPKVLLEHPLMTQAP